MLNGIIDLKGSDRGPTTALFKDIEARVSDDPRYGLLWKDDFITSTANISSTGVFTTNAATYVGTVATTGTINRVTSLGHFGAVSLTGPSNDGHGSQIQGGPTVIPAAGRVIALEGRLKIAAVAGSQLVFGLSIVDATVNTTSNTSTDHIAVECFTADGVLLPHTEDNTTRTSGTTIGTLGADTFAKVGMRINGISSVDFYFNGSKISTGLVADICEGTEIVPTLAVAGDGTTAITCTMDWWQLGVSSISPSA